MVLQISYRKEDIIRRWKLFLCGEGQIEKELLLEAMLVEHLMMMWPSLDESLKMLARQWKWRSLTVA